MQVHTTSKSVAEAQARIDDEVALLKLQTCALLTQRNALSPVSRLPHEILATVFLYQAYSFYQDPRYPNIWGAPPWANVSYVCRHWRAVALNCPSLWSFLFVFPPRWTEELLSRSKTVPLRIHVTQGRWARKEMVFVEKVTTDVTRIQDLRLKLPCNLAEEVFAKLSASAPLLHTLRLLVTKTGAESVLVPDTLFNRETPALQTLELYYCHIPWSTPIFTTLTTLRLCNLASPSLPTMTELLAILRHMPDLAHLYLEDAFSSANDILANQHSILSECLDLPHLSRLALVAPFSAVVAFLSNVAIPLKAELRLWSRGTLDDTESYTPLYPLLERRFNVTSDLGPVIRTLNIKTTSRGVGFVLSTSERDCDVPFYSVHGQYHLHEDWDRGISLKLDIEFNLRLPGDQDRLIGDICRTIPMVHLRTLVHFSSINVFDNLSSYFLKTTFGTLQELRFIRLIHLSMRNWVAALTPGLCRERSGVENVEDIFASALAELQVIAVTFGHGCRRRDLEDCEGTAWCLRRALARRKAKGYALKKLVIVDSGYVSDAQVEKLRTVVDEVDWDGYIQPAISISSSDGDD
ncbi:hypothetical protein BU15DRAFT_81175 [Melanogaster broomeanus]|nr:hypothetical protein BU15DRAFT_81175 [Melanogaster broomeanus]